MPYVAYNVKRGSLRALSSRRPRLSARLVLRIATRSAGGRGRTLAALSRRVGGAVGPLPSGGERVARWRSSWLAPAAGGWLYARVGFRPIILSRALTARIKRAAARGRLVIISRVGVAIRYRGARRRTLVRRARALRVARRLRLRSSVGTTWAADQSVDATQGVPIWDSARNLYAANQSRSSYDATHGDISFVSGVPDKWQAWRCFLCQYPQGNVVIDVTAFTGYRPVRVHAFYNENDHSKPPISCTLDLATGVTGTCRTSRVYHNNCGRPVVLPGSSHLTCDYAVDSWFVEAPGICDNYGYMPCHTTPPAGPAPAGRAPR